MLLLKFLIITCVVLSLSTLPTIFKLGRSTQIRDVDDARRIARDLLFDFKPMAAAIDKNNLQAVVCGTDGRLFLLKAVGNKYCCLKIGGTRIKQGSPEVFQLKTDYFFRQWRDFYPENGTLSFQP